MKFKTRIRSGWSNLSASKRAQIGFVCILDIAFSAVADTIVLPYTLYEQIRFGNFRPRLVDSVHERAERRRHLDEQGRLEACERTRESGRETDPKTRRWCESHLDGEDGRDGGE